MPDQKRLDAVEKFLRVVKRWFVVITILFFLILVGFSWTVLGIRQVSHDTANLSHDTANLAIENSKRINEIQDSRTASCKTTYRGIRKVFLPFFPSKPRTAQQQRDVDKFNSVVNDLVNGCNKQTKPHEDEKRKK